MEAADAGLPLVVCITEGIPASTWKRPWKYLQGGPTRLVGPNCPVLISPWQVSQIRLMPGPHPQARQRRCVVSRSGTLTYEARPAS